MSLLTSERLKAAIEGALALCYPYVGGVEWRETVVEAPMGPERHRGPELHVCLYKTTLEEGVDTAFRGAGVDHQEKSRDPASLAAIANLVPKVNENGLILGKATYVRGTDARSFEAARRLILHAMLLQTVLKCAADVKLRDKNGVFFTVRRLEASTLYEHEREAPWEGASVDDMESYLDLSKQLAEETNAKLISRLGPESAFAYGLTDV